MNRTLLAATLALSLACSSDSTPGTTPSEDVVDSADVEGDSETPGDGDGDAAPPDSDEIDPTDADEEAGDPTCAPCSEDADCAGDALCRSTEDGTWRCLVPCDAGSAVCPADATCEDLGGLLVCLPVGGCSCTPEHSGRTGFCTSEGGCSGEFGCSDDGEIACNAPEAQPEICNGKDDDCDLEVDEDADATCDDGSPCTVEACGESGCEYEPAPGTCLIGVNCYEDQDLSPSNPCSICDSSASPTTWTPRADGTACNDSLACTSGDACDAGACVGQPLDCDDDDTCTQDACDPGQGCVNAPLDDSECDDGDPCTLGDFCQAGGCVGAPLGCDDGVDCTADVCDGGVCSSATLVPDTCLIDGVCHDGGDAPPAQPCLSCDPDADPSVWTLFADGTPCEDGDQCTDLDACSWGSCVAEVVSCDDGNDCTIDVCFPLAGCKHQGVTGLPCDDGDPCSSMDICQGSACKSGAPITCDDANPCTADVCEPFVGCTFPPWDADCDDGDECTDQDACDAGECTGQPIDCSDSLDCTADGCTGGTCIHDVTPGFCLVDEECVIDGTPNPENPCMGCRADTQTSDWLSLPPGFVCDDGDACTTGELCQGGACVGGSPLDCDDGNPCTADSCEPASGCDYADVAGPCNDGLFCTVDDACDAGSCGGGPRDCTLLDTQCLAGTCDESAGACEAVPRPDGTLCDDSNLCSGPDQCLGGVCNGAAIAGCCAQDSDCDDSNPCTADSCETGGNCLSSAAVLDGTGCDDGVFCTETDLCQGGACSGAPRICPANDCNQGFCDEAGGACDLSEKPDGIGCGDDGNGCTDDVCDAGACTHPNNSEPCDDGDLCTFNDGCSGGGCSGAPYDCDDGKACTADGCLGDGTCDNLLAADSCVIAGSCRTAGTLDPGNPCQHCDPQTATLAWTPVPDGVGCPDDGDACTDDACSAGACTHPPNSAPCDDGQGCTQGDQCAGGSCLGAAYDCSDSVACTLDVCDGSGGCANPIAAGFCLVSGVCYSDGMPAPTNACQLCDASGDPTGWANEADATSCSDGSLCTEDDACQAGACLGAAVSCDDSNGCTDDSCVPATGCSNEANTKSCSDGLFCTVGDVCAATVCGGAPRDCTGAGDDCNDGVCDEPGAACVAQPVANGTPCSDGEVCTNPDTCQGGACAGSPLAGCCTGDSDCDDSNSCTADSCDLGTGVCTHDAAPLEGSGCDDGAFCTVSDECAAGACSGSPRDCSFLSDACNTGVCDEAGDTCEASPANEGDPCTDDGKVCTEDVCQGGSCIHPNNTAPCNDGELCTFNDTCNAGVCSGQSYDCDDGLACTADSCDGAGGCSNTLQGGFCLIAGSCATQGVVNAANDCQHCDPATSPTAWSDLPGGTACDDGNACTVGDACDAGLCEAGSNGCLQCASLAAGAPCDDGDGATVGDFCFSGVCAGFVKSVVSPAGAGKGPFLNELTWTAGGFHATGGADGGKEAWLATVDDGSVTVVGSTVRSDEVYTDVTEELAVTGQGTILRWIGGAWTVDSDLQGKVKAAGGGTTHLAAWGLATNAKRMWEITGRDGNAWVVQCHHGGSGVPTCAKLTVNFGEFSKEWPRAISGFGSINDATQVRTAVLSDYAGSSGGGGWYNDACYRIGAQVTAPFNNDFYDGGKSSKVSTDVHGTDDLNYWWTGTDGLLRRRKGGGGSKKWTNLGAVLGTSAAQAQYDLNGVWVNASVVLVAADHDLGGGEQRMVLITHDTGTAHDASANWAIIELEDLDPCGDKCTRPGRIGDVWVNGTTVVMVGFEYVESVDATRAVVFWRDGAAAGGVVPGG